MDGGARAGEVGVDLDAVHVADDERGRVLQILAVVEQLAVRRREVGVRALVLPAEVTALPDVGPALPARAQALGARLEGVVGARGQVVGCPHAEHPAEIDEVLLRRRLLAASALAPLGGELGGPERGGGGHRFPR